MFNCNQDVNDFRSFILTDQTIDEIDEQEIYERNQIDLNTIEEIDLCKSKINLKNFININEKKISHLVNLIKKNFNLIYLLNIGEDLTNNFYDNDQDKNDFDSKKLYENTMLIFKIIEFIVDKNLDNLNKLCLILIELSYLLKSIGHLVNLLETNTAYISSFTSNNDCFYCLFHCVLNIWMNTIKIYNDIYDKQIDVIEKFHGCKRNEIIEVILLDFMIIAYEKFRLFDSNISLSPFVCPCMKWSIIYLMRTFDVNNEMKSSLNTLNPFWLHFNKIIEKFITPTTNTVNNNQNASSKQILIELPITNYFYTIDEQQFTSTDVHLFVYSSLLNYCQLLTKLSENENKFSSNKCNFIMIAKILNLIIKSIEKQTINQQNEKMFILLNYSIKISKLLHSSIDLLLPLLEYFFKILISDNKQNLLTISNCNENDDEFNQITSIDWLNEISLSFNLTNTRKSFLYENKQNLLNLVLNLIFSCLNEYDENVQSQVTSLKKLKSRILLKFNSKRFDEMSERNFYYLLTLINCICYSCDDLTVEMLEKLSNYLLTLISTANCKNNNSTKVLLLIKSLFICFHFDSLTIRKNKQTVNNLLIQLHIKILNKLINALPIWTPGDSSLINEYNYLIDFLLCYLNEFELLFNENSKETIYIELIVSEYKNLFDKLSPRELIVYTNFIEFIVTKAEDQLKAKQSAQLAMKCIEIFLPFYKEKFLITGPINTITSFMFKANSSDMIKNLPKIAAQFTTISLLLQENAFSETDEVSSLFAHFGLNRKGYFIYIRDYLLLVLDNKKIINKVELTFGKNKFHSLLILIWFRLSLVMFNNEKYSYLSEKIYEIINDNDQEDSSDKEIMNKCENNYLIKYFYDLNFKYINNNLTIENKRQMLFESDKYLRDLYDFAEMLIKDNQCTNEILQNAYKVISTLVFHCSKLLYQRTSTECLLPLILETFFNINRFQKFSEQRKKFLTSQVHSLAATVMKGLTVFGYENNYDSYLQRKVNDLKKIAFKAGT